jgi:hypothetical protein
MSLVLAGRRRTYVLVLFRERVQEPGAALPSLRRLDNAIGAGMMAGTPSGLAAPTGARLIVSARVHRRWRRSLIGLSLFVLSTE